MIRRRAFLQLSSAGVLLACLHPAPALAREWVLLGSRDVRLAGDADTIPVKAPKGQFRQIQLRVRGNGVFIHDLTVVYGNGAADDIPVRAHIPQGGATRVIDLRGGSRNIKSVRLRYRSERDGQGHARVEVWGS
jgi:Protein of unknown function (DUF2541)